MKPVLVRERAHYSFAELKRLLGTENSATTERVINRLRTVGVVKVVDRQYFQQSISVPFAEEADEWPRTANSLCYQFNFVGLLSVFEWIVIVYPKYFSQTGYSHAKMGQVLRVIEKFNFLEFPLGGFDEYEQFESLNLTSLMLHLLRDYFESGLYWNDIEAKQINGTGEVLWDRTIDNFSPVLIKGEPVYLTLLTAKRQGDEHSFFRRLHAVIVTMASSKLEALGILELLGLTAVQVSYEDVYDLGGIDFIKERILNEVSREFNTRKLFLLKAMLAFISDETYDSRQSEVRLFGSSSFNLVWEGVCSRVLGNQMERSVSSLGLKLSEESSMESRNLRSLIERPTWHGTDEKGDFSVSASDTLRPDILRVEREHGELVFYILDAKYYAPTIARGVVKRQPGVADVTKQYLYELAYRELLEAQGAYRTVNSFLVPWDGSYVKADSKVSMKILDNLGLSQIYVRLVPAERFYDCFLADREVSLFELRLENCGSRVLGNHGEG